MRRVRRCLQSKRFRHSSGQIIHSHRGVNLNAVQFQTLRFLVEAVGEHGIAIEQVAEGPFRVACFSKKSPLRSPTTIHHSLTELGSREKPNCVTTLGEQRLNEAWRQSEALGDHTGVLGQAKDIFDNHAEALSPKPVECLKHGFRGSVHPSLVHVHRDELMQKWAALRCASPGVIWHHVVGRVELLMMLSRNAASDCRFAGATPATDPVDVPELLLKRFGVCSQLVSFSFHPSTFLMATNLMAFSIIFMIAL